MNANVTHVMYVGLATAGLAAGTPTGLSAGTSIDAIVPSLLADPRREARLRSPAEATERAGSPR
jgi:hypothetical protein